ncbi:hypothetical protein FSP39_008842 [Pinctada imbricata]|uniref:Tubulin epsilon and delta complex protein 1 domain-containing protein n=1 Tax=Pinctada imbricata TaxID=66713 RepID=A0AA88XZ83_PINIB|nr:hypothetical protein FSP39_008842 [Pinctada imbricata]
MAQVRETIELLTNLLTENGTSKTKAELFRLAKFNKDEATLPFWRLLFELLYFCRYGVMDEVAVKAYSELTTEELIVYVKQEMQERGFLSREFSALPNSAESGSRELLLGMAWLLCKEDIIDKFMDKCASPIDDEPVSYFQPNVVERSKNSNQELASQSLKPAQKVQQLQLLNGKLRMSLRRLYALQRERTKLQHQIHECTEGVSLSADRNHLSSMEVHMLRHPELLKKIMSLLEKDNDRLQHLLLWKDKEEIFWKWMESVLDLKLQEMTGRPDDLDMVYYNIPPDCVRQMESAREELEEAVLKYETIIEKMEDMWESKVEEVTTEELDKLLASINMEISLQKANLTLGNMEDRIHHYKEPRLIYARNSAKNKLTNVTGGSNYGTGSNKYSASRQGQGDFCDVPIDIQNEISALESQLQRLELETERKRSRYRAELDNMACSIPEVICIEPMPRS